MLMPGHCEQNPVSVGKEGGCKLSMAIQGGLARKPWAFAGMDFFRYLESTKRPGRHVQV